MAGQRRRMLKKEWFRVLLLAGTVAILLRSTDLLSSGQVLAGVLPSHLLRPCPAVTLCASETATSPKDSDSHFPYQWTMDRYSENPVLRAVPGTWETCWFVVDDVLKMDGKYYMYYSSSDKGNKNSRLGLAVSSDGVKWKRHPENPIWERAWHHFLRDVRVYRFGEADFRLYYSDGDQHIDLARSADGIHWRNDERNPVLTSTQLWEALVMQQRILRIGDKWFMWYSTYDGKPRVTGTATSEDGIRWTKYKQNPVLPLGKPGEWDDYSAFQPSVFVQDGYFHMIYTGSSEANPTGYRWGYAYSQDGIDWVKSPRNPVFVPGDKGSWDGGKVSCHTILRTGDSTFNIYYAGATRADATYQGIGMVRARLKRSTFQEKSN